MAINYGRGATKREVEGESEVLHLQKDGHKTFWGSFNTGA